MDYIEMKIPPNDPSLDWNNKYPPYSSVYFKNLYEGIVIEMHLVDHCNLKCAGCNHLAPFAKEFYIDKEIFKDQLEYVVKNLPSIKRLFLLGGEPTLHPQLIELCKIARDILPTQDILIFTNGVNLEPWVEYVDFFKQKNIGFGICAYPGQLEDKNVQLFLSEKIASYNNTRMFMEQVLVDDTGSQNSNVNRYYHCTNSQLPCFQLKNYKLYVCPFSAYLDNYRNTFNVDIPEDQTDFIDIRTIDINKLIKFLFTPKNICKYCVPGGGGHWIWHKSDLDKKEINVPFLDLYYTDYDRYLKIINNKDYFLKCINQDESYLDFRYCTENVEKHLKRFGYGKIDIIIPYRFIDNSTIIQLHNTLINQDLINDCVCYFISDNSPDEKFLIDYFKATPLNCVFLKSLKNIGPGLTRQIGIDNSFNSFIVFLDADDYFISSQSLSKIYNIMIENNLDVYYYDMVRDDQDLSNLSLSNLDNNIQKFASKKEGIYKRNFLENNNIKFSSLFVGEDYVFANKISKILFNNSKKLIDSKYINGIYTISNNVSSISYIFDNKISMLLSQLIAQCIALLETQLILKNIDKDQNYEYYKNNFETLNTLYKEIECLKTKDISFFILAFYILHITFLKFNQNLISSIEIDSTFAFYKIFKLKNFIKMKTERIKILTYSDLFKYFTIHDNIFNNIGLTMAFQNFLNFFEGES